MIDEKTPQQEQAIERKRLIVQEFTEKKSSYPAQWKPIYDECKADEDFVLVGTQMTPQQARKFGFGTNYQMPNLLKTYINNQANQTLQNNYRAVVTPNGGGADVTKARWREQAVRGIQRVGGAAQCYNNARRGQLAGGLHYSKVVIDFANYRGWEKQYEFEDILDTYSVFPDPFVKNATFKDMEDFLIKEDIPKSQWQKKTGTEWTHGSEKTHAVWYYWRKAKVVDTKEYLDLEGNGVLADSLPMGADNSPDMSGVKLAEDGTPYSRDVVQHEWEWFIIDDNADSIFNEGTWLGECSPLVACSGEKVVEKTDGGIKVHYYGLARDAKEPQMVYTILENIILLRLARSPYSKWKIAYESIVMKQLEAYRKNAVIGENDIMYNAYDEKGNALPSPEEIQPHILDAILVELQQVQIQKIERILGIFDAAMGQQSNEKSGVAIKERAKQSNLANYHFEFNFLEYVKQIGYVVIESMPNYLTVKQVIPFVDNDDKVLMQEINGPSGISFQSDERYSLVVEVMPDSDSNREAEAEMLMRMADSKFLGPTMMQVPGAAALIVKAQKGRYAQQIGAMMEDAKADPEKAQMEQQMNQMRQQGKALQEQLAQLQKDRSLEEFKEANRHEEKMAELQLKAANDADKTEIEKFNAETNREKANGIPQEPNSLGAPGDLLP